MWEEQSKGLWHEYVWEWVEKAFSITTLTYS